MATGQRNTYGDSNLKKIVISTDLGMIDPRSAPLLAHLGVDNASKFGLQQMGTKYEWLEDTMSPTAGTIAEDLTTTETDVDVTAGNGAYLKKYDIIKVGTETMLITSISTDTLTVIRAWNGDRTTGSAASNGAAWVLAGSAAVEGSASVTGHTTETTRPYNYTQILKEAVSVSGSEMEDPKWAGEQDTMVRHLNKLMGEGGKAGKLPILLEKIFAYGSRYVGTSSVSRSAGGFDTFVTTNNVALAGAALTRSHIEDRVVAAVEAGGIPDTIIVPQWARRKLSSFGEKYITTERKENVLGSTIDVVHTNFADLDVFYWRNCPADTLYIVEKQYMGWTTFRPFSIYDRPTDVDGKVKEVLGEFGFVVRNEKAHAKISGFSTTA